MQLRKARLPISFNDPGSFTERIPLLSKKQLFPSASIPSGISTCFRLVKNRTSVLSSSSIIRRTSTAISRTRAGIGSSPATASTALGIRKHVPLENRISWIFPQPVNTSQMQLSSSSSDISSLSSITSLTNTCLPSRFTPGIRTSVRLSQ